MIGRILGLVSLLASSACATINDASYVLGSGDANYDALKSATDACAAKGGVVRPRPNYDGRQLSGYVCAIGKAR